MEVVTWSLQCLGLGRWPDCRHDNKPWGQGDALRKRKTGSITKAALVEVRGDWKFFGEVFCFPKHNTNAGICWNCKCTPNTACIYVSPLHDVTQSWHSSEGALAAGAVYNFLSTASSSSC